MNLFFKNQKPYRQKSCNQKWIFGGVVSGDLKKCFFEYLERRDAATLEEAVRRKFRPGSIVYRDQWSAYPGLFVELDNYNLVNLAVNH